MLRSLNISSGGKRILGTPKVGVPGSSIPASGDNGPGIAYNDLSLPADANKAIRVRITAWPSAGTLFVFEDTSFEFYGAPDGTYSFQYQLIVDGSDVGPVTTVTLQVGGVTHVASGTLVASAALVAGAARRFVIHTADGTLLASNASAAASARHNIPHAATGALGAGSASLLAYAALPGPVSHDAVVGLSAGAAAVLASAERLTVAVFHDASGTLVADMALVLGAAATPSTGLTLSEADIDAIAQRVWQYATRGLTVDITSQVIAELHASPIPVDAITGNWPSATDNADAVWDKTLS